MWIVTLLLGLLLGPLVGGAQGVGLESYDGRVTWTPNAETDLACYRLYRRTTNDPKAPRTLVKEYQRTTASISTHEAKLPAGQHYLSLTACDTSKNESPESVPLVPFVQLVRDLRPKNFVISNITNNAARVTFQQDPLAKANIRWMAQPFAWGAAASIDCPLNVCELKNLPSGTAIGVQGIGYTGEMNTPSVVYTEFSPLVSFSTKAVVIIDPPPVAGDKFIILLNKGNSIVAQYKAAECPNGISQITSGAATKIVTWTCRR